MRARVCTYPPAACLRIGLPAQRPKEKQIGPLIARAGLRDYVETPPVLPYPIVLRDNLEQDPDVEQAAATGSCNACGASDRFSK